MKTLSFLVESLNPPIHTIPYLFAKKQGNPVFNGGKPKPPDSYNTVPVPPRSMETLSSMVESLNPPIHTIPYLFAKKHENPVLLSGEPKPPGSDNTCSPRSMETLSSIVGSPNPRFRQYLFPKKHGNPGLHNGEPKLPVQTIPVPQEAWKPCPP
jgi:hypothetical protein